MDTNLTEQDFSSIPDRIIYPVLVLNDEKNCTKIWADERNAQYGKASHAYEIAVGEDGKDTDPLIYAAVNFQCGPVKEAGRNGIQNEHLLRIVEDRLSQFQASQFNCAENEAALSHVRFAIQALEERTRNREARNVEGRNIQ